MEITEITFNVKDVITIVIGISSFTGFYYALKRSVEKVNNDLDSLEIKQKKDTEAIMSILKEHKENLQTSEEHVYARISEIREEQRNANDKLESKIDSMATHISSMNTCLAELTGYIKAKKS
jgi:hypothetical protein